MTATPTTAPKRRGRRAYVPPSTDQATGPRRVCIYMRRSTDDEHQPFSLDAQRAALEKYVASQPGYTIVAEYEDDASGATTERPGLQRALQAAKAGMFDVLLVYRLDRFSRSVANLLDLIKTLETAKVRFSSATEPVDTGGPFGRMMVQLLGVFAEFERNIIIDRVKSGMAAKASKGKWAGGSRPYGYRIQPDTSHLVPDPDEAPVLRDIFRLYTHDRLGTRAIATELNSRGIPNRNGRPWSGQTINRILDNPAYTGDIAFNDTYVPEAHEALVDRDTFHRAQQIAAGRNGTHQQRAMSSSDYYLTGLITCPECGNRYVGTSANGRTRRYRYYTCFTRARYGKTATCAAPRLPADEVDDLVLHALYDFYTTAEPVLTAMIDRARAQQAAADTDQHAEHVAVTHQIATTEAAIARYHTAFEQGTMDDATAGPRIRDLRQRLAQLQTRQAQLEAGLDGPPAAPPPATITGIRDCLAAIMSSGTMLERKAAIEALVAEVQLTDQGVIPVFKIPTPDTTMPPPETDEGTTEARTMVRLVELRGLEP
ncbi:recombinase family protein [Dactylosporangium aurantiacum]|uniref:Recombinase family protein n=1 Tax=Dactylosporangium aurantiacum TaxID=35754 RepID=A0A9Q9IJR4_9ACTN|nr:recombinase family protein [Dactylosporangium aurantiacum]MDG6100514.1 recombinase family protein [Dactylosporangium aurantiacum]UWZ55385.1 recombinase family protein [Dactylosporangium aurantiacum]